jgi:hypothetical protein
MTRQDSGAGERTALEATAQSILEDTGSTLRAQIAGLNNLSAAQALAQANAALAAYDPPTKARWTRGTLC